MSRVTMRRNLVNNFVSGLVLLFDRRIDVGDAVQIGEVSGRLQQMGMRACTVRTWEGAEVIVPNASLTADKVTNWTLSDRLRRVDVGVGVAYGTPPSSVQGLLLGVARAHPQVLPEPAPVALFLGFGDSALRFEMRVWTDRFDLWVQTQSELAVACTRRCGRRESRSPCPSAARCASGRSEGEGWRWGARDTGGGVAPSAADVPMPPLGQRPWWQPVHRD